MEGNVFSENLLKQHEGAGEKRLFTLLADKISEDADLYETHTNNYGEEDFRLKLMR